MVGGTEEGIIGAGDAGVQVTGGGDTGVQKYAGGGVEIPRCVKWRVLGTVAGGFWCPRWGGWWVWRLWLLRAVVSTRYINSKAFAALVCTRERFPVGQFKDRRPDGIGHASNLLSSGCGH